MATMDKNGYWHGTVGDHVYYILNGKQVRRRRAKPSRGPKTKGKKRNALLAVEFGKASSAGKYLRQALEPECLRLEDRYLSQRVSSFMMKLKNCHQSPEGTRTCTGGLCTPEGKIIFDSFTFQAHKKTCPKIVDVLLRRGNLSVSITPYRRQGVSIIQLQINLATGSFRRHDENLPPAGLTTPLVLKKKFRRKKGYTDMVFIAGNNFLQGFVLHSKEAT